MRTTTHTKPRMRVSRRELLQRGGFAGAALAVGGGRHFRVGRVLRLTTDNSFYL